MLVLAQYRYKWLPDLVYPYLEQQKSGQGVLNPDRIAYTHNYASTKK